MTRIAIVGPGAIGGTMAAWLAQDARHQITVAARTPFVSLQLDTPTRTIEARPIVITRPESATPADWVLVATKAYDTSGAATWLKAFMNDQTRVAILQNGVEHIERFSSYVAPARILPVMVDCPAERVSPGHIRQRGIARMAVPRGESARSFVALFRATQVQVTEVDDFHTQLWRKLCLNSVGALSAILLRPAVIARHAGVADLMRQIIREAIAVGRAEGASLDDSLADSIIDGYRTAPPDSVNSMHADRVAGRPMEIDARNGAIVRFGQRHGIPTPLNSMIVALLEAATLPA
ncbi:MAG: 2-dehydropantoate 2-reductase [Povalibacter sp.]